MTQKLVIPFSFQDMDRVENGEEVEIECFSIILGEINVKIKLSSNRWINKYVRR